MRWPQELASDRCKVEDLSTVNHQVLRLDWEAEVQRAARSVRGEEAEAAAFEAEAGLAAAAEGGEAEPPPVGGAGKKGGAGARGGGKRAAAADKVKLLVEEESRVALDYEQGEIVE